MNMPKLQFIIICEQAFLTAGSNNLNIIGVFSQINASKFPFIYPRFALVTNFDADSAGQHVLQTDILDPNGKRITHTELPVKVTTGNMQVIASFENMQFAVPGQYAINIALDNQPLGQCSIRIMSVITPISRKPSLA